MGLGSAASLARGARLVPGWTALLRDQRANLWRALVSSQVRIALRRTAAQAGVRRRFAPHQLRHAHAVEMAREGVPLNVIQRQLGHANLGVTSIYLQGIDSGEIIETVRTRRAPVIPAAAALAASAFRPKRGYSGSPTASRARRVTRISSLRQKEARWV